MSRVRDLSVRAAVGVQTRTGTLLLLVALFVLFATTATYGRVSPDVRAVFVPAWELGQRHTINSDGYLHVSKFLHLVDGHVRSDRFPGGILPAVPAYAVVALLGGTSQPTIWPSALTAALMAAGSVVFMHRALLRVVAPGLALGAALVFALGTSTWTVAGDAMWTHTSTQLGICTALYGIAADRARWCVLGMLLAASARPHMAAVAAVLAVGLLLRTRSWRLPLAIAAGTAAGWAVILGWTHLTYTHATLLPGSYAGRGGDLGALPAAGGGQVSAVARWTQNIEGFAYSPERGVLVATPILLLCLVGVLLAWRRAPGWTKDAALAGCVYAVVQLAGNGFSGGGSYYSYRLAIETVTLLTPLAVVGAAAMLRFLVWRLAAIVLVAYGVAVNAIGAIYYTNVTEKITPWDYYQPYLLSRDAPQRAVWAGAIGLVAAIVVGALARSDPDPAVPGPGGGHVDHDDYDYDYDYDYDGGQDGDGPPPGPGGATLYRNGKPVTTG